MINKQEGLASTDMEKAELLSKFLASVFVTSQSLHISHIPEPLAGFWESKIPPTVKEKQIRDCLIRLNVYKSMRPDDTHS